MFLLRLILPGTLCASWTWLNISFPVLGEFSAIISSNNFSGPFLLSFPSGTQMLECLMLSQRSQAVFISFHSFFYILFCGNDFHCSVLWVNYPFFCLSYSALAYFSYVFHLCLFVLYFF